MSCKNCDDQKGVAYYRLGNANVGLIGCDRHLNELLRKVDGRPDDRVIHRVNSDTKYASDNDGTD